MRWILISLLLIVLRGAEASALETVGDWSAPIGGLEGRLCVTENAPSNGTRMLAVYLELRNVSDVANPIEIYYDNNNSTGTVTNRQEKIVSAMNGPSDIMLPTPYWLALPHDSTLRFRISTGGYGIPKDSGAMVDMRGGPWILKSGSDAPYFLGGTFKAAKQKEAVDNQWQGTLDLPRVRLPIRSPNEFRITGPR